MKIGRYKIRRREIFKWCWTVFAVLAIASMLIGTVSLGLGRLR